MTKKKNQMIQMDGKFLFLARINELTYPNHIIIAYPQFHNAGSLRLPEKLDNRKSIPSHPHASNLEFEDKPICKNSNRAANPSKAQKLILPRTNPAQIHSLAPSKLTFT